MPTNAKYRVLVDWNKDGWFDTGVSSDTPLNLVPDPLWGVNNVTALNYPGTDGTLSKVDKTFYPTDYGYSELSTPLLTTNDGLFLGFKGMQYGQPNGQLTSVTSIGLKSTPLISGTASMNFSLFKLKRSYDFSAMFGVAHPVVVNTGLLAAGSVTATYIGYNGTTYTPIASVTAGNTYTVRILSSPNTAYSPLTGSSYVLRILNQAGTVIASSPGTGLTTGSNTDLTFTAPVGMTGLVLKIDVTSGATANLDAIFGGVQMYAGTPLTGAMYAWPVDAAIGFSEEQFDVVVPAGQAYTMSVWTRQTGGSVLDDTVSVIVGTIGSTVYTELTPATYTPSATNTWVRITYNVPAQASRSGLILRVIYNNTRTNEFAGFQVVAGSNALGFNTGDTSAPYEDITDYVKEATWKSGKTAMEDVLPFEGEAQIVINNESRIFSPSNVDSPLYTLMDRGLKVQIQTRWDEQAAWDIVWTGWTDTYEVDPGTNGQRETLLRAKQGISRMRDGKLWFLNTEDADFNDTVQTMINESGWLSSNDVATSLVGFETLVDVNAYVADPDSGWELIEDAIGTVDFVGFGWNEETLVKDAITDLLASQDAHLFINRDGKLSIYNREHFINVWLKYDDTVDLNAYPNVHYQYGEDIVNSVSVTIQRKRGVPDGVLWETKRAIKVFPNSTRELTVNFQFDEGGAKTPLGDMTPTYTIYFSDPGLAGSVAPEVVDNTLMAYANGELLHDGSSRTYLRLHNNFATKPVWFNVSISGRAVDRGDKETLVVDNDAAIEALNELQKTTFSNDLISDQPAAYAAAWVILGRRSLPAGEFDKFGFFIEDEDHYDLMQSLTLADRLIMEEYQTGEENLQHVILEENGQIISGGLMKIEYIVKRTDQTKYAYVEGILESKYDNLIWEFPINATMDGTVTPVSEQLRVLDTGVFGSDFYVGVEPLDVSAGSLYKWLTSAGKVDLVATQLGSIFNNGTNIGSNNSLGYIPVIPEAKYYFNIWLYAGSDFSGSVTFFGSNWANSGLAATVSATSSVPVFTLKRDNPFRAHHFTGGYQLPTTFAFVSYAPGWANIVKALPEQIPLDSSKTYTVSMWARPGSGYAATSYTLEVIDQTGAVLGSASSSFNSGSIDRLSVTFTTASNVYFRIKNDTGLVRHVLNVYGFKMVEGSTAAASYPNILNPDFLYMFP